jgi:hypothetical protein
MAQLKFCEQCKNQQDLIPDLQLARFFDLIMEEVVRSLVLSEELIGFLSGARVIVLHASEDAISKSVENSQLVVPSTTADKLSSDHPNTLLILVPVNQLNFTGVVKLEGVFKTRQGAVLNVRWLRRGELSFDQMRYMKDSNNLLLCKYPSFAEVPQELTSTLIAALDRAGRQPIEEFKQYEPPAEAQVDAGDLMDDKASNKRKSSPKRSRRRSRSPRRSWSPRRKYR